MPLSAPLLHFHELGLGENQRGPLVFAQGADATFLSVKKKKGGGSPAAICQQIKEALFHLFINNFHVILPTSEK